MVSIGSVASRRHKATCHPMNLEFFPTAYHRIYCRKSLILSNQMSHKINKCIRMSLHHIPLLNMICSERKSSTVKQKIQFALSLKRSTNNVFKAFEVTPISVASRDEFIPNFHSKGLSADEIWALT